MPRILSRVFAAALLSALLVSPRPAAAIADRIRLTVDTSEAEAVLAILSKTAAKKAVADADWTRLFTSEPYVRLKKREAGMKRDFTDEEFRRFVLAPERAQEAQALGSTVAAWKKADLAAAATRVLAYLPADAVIHAKVYPVIKPGKNSFVFDMRSDPAIFLYVDPKVSPAKFENTVAHELHHIGYASIETRTEKTLDGLDPKAKKAAEWVGAFGEGFAMLAAAGSSDVHPHAVSTPEERARWDKDMARVDEDLRSVERFLLDVATGTLTKEDEIDERAMSFFGIQGPWYTVGYRMAVVIEREEGRAILIDCMSDPRRLLATYDRDATRLAARTGEKPAIWSDELMTRLAGPERQR